MPANTVKVDRSTGWGNPFIVNTHVKPGSRSGALYICVPTLEDAIECYREYLGRGLGEYARKQLRGKNLACWCKLGEPCHADILLEIANAGVAALGAVHDAPSAGSVTGTENLPSEPHP